MNQTVTKGTGTINTKGFHRLEKCQRCNGYKQNTDLRHIAIGARLHCLCHECYQIIKRDPVEWRRVLK
jgi:hypothetical protein